MFQNKETRPYRINIHYGEKDLHGIVDDLALQVISKNVNEFSSGNYRAKKIKLYGRAV
ncbi:MAG: hypothetical protein K6T72_03555 [Anoxybacillus sp.]|nr:hypothetical protein [Anoxybacillus sp.]MCL6585584.1 hypothetical protein [Anoxybacillus sp.]